MDMSDLNIPWLESPFFEKLLARRDLDEATRGMVRSFAADGFLTFDPEIPDFGAVAAEIIAACSKRRDYPERVADAWAEIEGVRRLALAPRVLSLLRTLFGRQPIPMQTLNFGRGTEQRAHSDSMHFCSFPTGFMCGVWFALEDIDDDNGPLEYYPGSHRLPYLDHASIGVTGSDQKAYERYGSYEELVQLVIKELGLERRVLRMKKGQALVWAANLLHGGSPIKDSSRTRHSQVNHYFFEGCLYYQPQRSDPFLGRILWLDKRDVRTGRLIPQSYNGRPAPVRRDFVQRLEWLARRAGLDRALHGSRLASLLRRALRGGG
jgi:hypothetical protein